MKKKRYKPYIPAVITGNVRSLADKVDELKGGSTESYVNILCVSQKRGCTSRYPTPTSPFPASRRFELIVTPPRPAKKKDGPCRARGTKGDVTPGTSL